MYIFQMQKGRVQSNDRESYNFELFLVFERLDHKIVGENNSDLIS